MDRCALFVDAGYVLSDGAMAVHGTRHRDSVAWDYPGLLKFLAGLARERTGMPVLRCYWYEAAVDSRRTAEYDALADIPGLKLRLGKTRPDRREGAVSDIHRDLTTLARNKAVTDAVLVCAEEDLAPVVAEVQDLGIRVLLMHVTADGTWTVPQALRQECDDIMDVSTAHLRPFVDLISSAEVARGHQEHAASRYPDPARDLPAGQDQRIAAVPRQQPSSQAAVAAAAIYPVPAAGEYRPASQPPARGVAPAGVPQDQVRGVAEPEAERTASAGQGPLAGGGQAQSAMEPPSPDVAAMNGHYGRQPYPAPEQPGSASASAPNGLPGSIPLGRLAPNGLHAGPAQSSQPESSQPQNGLHASPPVSGLPQNGLHASPPVSGLPQNGLSQNGLSQNGLHASSVPSGLPQNGLPQNGQPQNGLPQNGPSGRIPQNGLPGADGAAHAGPPRQLPGGIGAPYSPAPANQFGPADQSMRDQFPAARPGQSGVPTSGHGFGAPAPEPYSALQPAGGRPPVPPQVSVSMADAIQAAQAEGHSFGEAVARDAPALWLEAVLARKPRMPSDLEARLLQGSALPVDSLLYDEVRHALRRGFWDALERSRR